MKTLIISLIILLSITTLHGQNTEQLLTDTIWTSSGEVIPCKIVSIDSADNSITIRYYNAKKQLTYEPMLLENVENYSIGETDKENQALQLLPDSLKKLKAYAGFGFGYPRTLGVSFTLILKNDWGGSLSCKHTSFNKTRRLREGNGIWDYATVPGDQFNEISLFIVREFLLKTSYKVRFGVEAGPSLVGYMKVDSYTKNSGLFGSYYTSTTTSYITGGVAFRAKIEATLSVGFGIEFAVYVNVNPKKPHGGIELYFSVGKVRDRIIPSNL